MCLEFFDEGPWCYLLPACGSVVFSIPLSFFQEAEFCKQHGFICQATFRANYKRAAFVYPSQYFCKMPVPLITITPPTPTEPSPVTEQSSPRDKMESNSLHSSVSTLYDFDSSPEALVYAILAENPGQVRDLANIGVSIWPTDSWIIYEACLQGPEMIEAISSSSTISLNPFIPGQMGDTVFHFLLRTLPGKFPSGKKNTIKLLLEKGVDPLQIDRLGNTSLHILAGDEDPSGLEIMDLLLGDDTSISESARESCASGIDDQNGKGPLSRAGEGGSTALMVAVRQNQASQVRLLLKSGASPHIKGEYGHLPLRLAVARNFVGVAEMLLKHGAIMEKGMTIRSREMDLVLEKYA